MIFRLENLSSEPPCVGKARHSENKSCTLLNRFKRGSEPHSFLSLINFNAFPGTVIAFTKMILYTQILKLASPGTGRLSPPPTLIVAHLQFQVSQLPWNIPQPPKPSSGNIPRGSWKNERCFVYFVLWHLLTLPSTSEEGKAHSARSQRRLTIGNCRVLPIPSSEKGAGSLA